MASSRSGPDRRILLASGAAALLAWPVRASVRYDAVVAKPGQAAPAGARFESLGEALAAAPLAGPFGIWLGAGTWTEKLAIQTAKVSITGEDRQHTRLRYDAAAGLKNPTGAPWGTSGSATLTVSAPGFRADNLTIENGFDPAEEARRSGLVLGDWPGGQQAVALMLAAGSDRAILRNADILGRQDSLFTDSGTALFDRCLITGTVDFIFGAGLTLLRDCEIRSRTRPPGQPPGGCIAAPSTKADQEAGLIFLRCNLTAEPGVPDDTVFLGRPWRPTRGFPDGRYGDPQALGMAAYMDCFMGSHIAPTGWTEMSYNGRHGERVALQPETARFYETGNTGPGAQGIRRSRPLDQALRARLGYFARGQ
ncbi:MAG: pectinesterase family protein [Sphingomonas sp.]